MTGWLIVNEYLNTLKFKELTDLFMAAAKIKEVSLQLCTNADFIVNNNGCVVKIKSDDVLIEADPTIENPDFVIFHDKDIELARTLEENGIKVFNCAKAIEICDSKYKTTKMV